ncbi:pilus assembly protein [Alteromonadaceae bacterium M269]|nr:pilus assembly protein [Alteromonadaceae bacterium M269]
MITVAIVGVLLTTVVPNARGLLIRNRIVAEVNYTSSLMQFARHTAIDEQAVTIMCPSTDFSNCTADWTQPKIVFVDANNNGTRNDDEELLVGSEQSHDTHAITGPNAPIRFSGNGTVASPATILFCHNGREAEFARALILSLQGRVKLSADSNNDGIYEDNNGMPLSCAG